MKIVFVNNSLLMGGIEKAIELLVKELKNIYDIEILYLDDSYLDIEIVNCLSKQAKVCCISEYKDNIISCDVCIWCSLYFDYAKIKKIVKADRYFAWVHSMPRAFPNCLLDDLNFVNDLDKIICVSNAVKNNLKLDNKESIVIHNFIDCNIIEKSKEFNPFKSTDSLKLVTVSRLSRGKGFDRIKTLSENFQNLNIPYEWIIVGNGRSSEKIIKNLLKGDKNIYFVGKKLNPYPYIVNANYLVQLSDEESWGIVITEAKILKTPCIITNFESSSEQITHLFNGIILPLNSKDFSGYCNDIVNFSTTLKNNLQNFEFNNEIDKWLELF